jgi:hypothetical protein
MIGRSHEATQQWVRRSAPVCDGFDADREHFRNWISVFIFCHNQVRSPEV